MTPHTPTRDELPDEKCSICGFTADAADLVGHLREQHNGIAYAVSADKETHSCACQFKNEECVDPCCYHIDLEERHAQLKKDFDALRKDYATEVNGKKGLDLYGQPLPSPTPELVAALERFKDKMAKAKALDNPRVFVEEYIAEAIEAADDYLAALAAHGGK